MTDIPKTPMAAERGHYAVERMLTHMGHWQHYAAEPPTDFDHAQDKLQALASVMGAMIGDIIEKWDWMMIHGSPEEAFENDLPPLISPDLAEAFARRARERRDAV